MAKKGKMALALASVILASSMCGSAIAANADALKQVLFRLYES